MSIVFLNMFFFGLNGFFAIFGPDPRLNTFSAFLAGMNFISTFLAYSQVK